MSAVATEVETDWWRDLPRTGHYVYGLHDRNDNCVYVGVTSNLRQRMQAHSRKWWWPVIVRDTLELVLCETREEANACEARMIAFCQPHMNRAGRS